MNDQVLSAIRSVLKIGGGWLIAKGYADNSNVEMVIAGILAAAGIVWSWAHHQANTPMSKP